MCTWSTAHDQDALFWNAAAASSLRPAFLSAPDVSNILFLFLVAINA